MDIIYNMLKTYKEQIENNANNTQSPHNMLKQAVPTMTWDNSNDKWKIIETITSKTF